MDLNYEADKIFQVFWVFQGRSLWQYRNKNKICLDGFR